MATYGAYPIDDGGGSQTQVWQQVIATVTDV
jgi:sugar (pentulose or hexulose) kinase